MGANPRAVPIRVRAAPPEETQAVALDRRRGVRSDHGRRRHRQRDKPQQPGDHFGDQLSDGEQDNGPTDHGGSFIDHRSEHNNGGAHNDHNARGAATDVCDSRGSACRDVTESRSSCRPDRTASRSASREDDNDARSSTAARSRTAARGNW